MDNNLKLGGDLIGMGSYGCVFYPGIKCNSSHKGNYTSDNVSKIFFDYKSKKEANYEFTISKLLSNIRGHENWAVIWNKACVPPEYDKISKIEPQIRECLEDNNITVRDFNKNKYMLIGTYSGNSLMDLIHNIFNKITKKDFNKNFLYLMKIIKPLFIGLVEMNKNNILHHDIKYDNIIFNGNCKYIDFGLSCKYSDNSFIMNRINTEFQSARIYPSYPYEFIYLFADEYNLNNEYYEISDEIYRGLHERYILVHETLFGRKNTKQYLLNLINYAKDGKLMKEKTNIISTLDTYSLGILVPYILLRIAKSYNKLHTLKKLLLEKEIKPFIDLFKSMCEPDNKERLNPLDAYNKYLELEKLYLNKDTKKVKNTKNRRRTRRA